MHVVCQVEVPLMGLGRNTFSLRTQNTHSQFWSGVDCSLFFFFLIPILLNSTKNLLSTKVSCVCLCACVKQKAVETSGRLWTLSCEVFHQLLAKITVPGILYTFTLDIQGGNGLQILPSHIVCMCGKKQADFFPLDMCIATCQHGYISMCNFSWILSIRKFLNIRLYWNISSHQTVFLHGNDKSHQQI